MYLLGDKVKDLAKREGLTLVALLEKAGISKTAYYHLTRKESLLPKSILSLAQVLKVRPSALLEEDNPQEKIIQKLRKSHSRILSQNPQANPENVWHTLVLLEKEPWERLERGLLRAQKYNFYR